MVVVAAWGGGVNSTAMLIEWLRRQRALAMEANAELDTVKGLGRRFSWQSVLEQDRRQLKLFEMPEEPCNACYDGDDDD